jgi:hypothetical protein
MQTVWALKQWGEAVGHSWRLDARAEGGVTPLHLLGLLGNSGELATAVTGLWGVWGGFPGAGAVLGSSGVRAACWVAGGRWQCEGQRGERAGDVLQCKRQRGERAVDVVQLG